MLGFILKRFQKIDAPVRRLWMEDWWRFQEVENDKEVDGKKELLEMTVGVKQ